MLTPAREQLQTLLAARRVELARCPDAPTRLTLTIDVGPRVVLAEIQHVVADPEELLDRSVSSIVEALALPQSAIPTRHNITLDLAGV